MNAVQRTKKCGDYTAFVGRLHQVRLLSSRAVIQPRASSALVADERPGCVYFATSATKISTRRFMARPAGVPLSAIGWLEPRPSIAIRLDATPRATR